MAINCGIIGLPNVGKSTLFSALTSIAVEAANYPFCTIDANCGIVAVQDPRLERIASIIPAAKIVPATIEFVDIAGLVAGASRGEGLGNRFLAHIREVGLLIHVVRCFTDENVVHVAGTFNPLSDVETITTELALADLSTVEKAAIRYDKLTRSGEAKDRLQAQQVLLLLKQLEAHLAAGRPARQLQLEPAGQQLIHTLQLITAKPQIYLCNIDDSPNPSSQHHAQLVAQHAASEGTEVLQLSSRLEADIAALESEEERKLFLADAGLAESGLTRLARLAYHCLGLRTFFTVGGVENRAWTFQQGATAPQTAGIIHSDFEKGFIRAEVYHCDELFQLGSEAKLRSAGKIRQEGRDYLVRDGDVMHFKFNL